MLRLSVKKLNAVLGLPLLLLACISSRSEAAELFDGCDHAYTINPGISYLESPYYPNKYNAGTSCRYKFTAPLDYYIEISCTIEMPKDPNACSTEFFYLARDGDLQLQGSEQLCGNGTVTRQSVFRSVVLAYASYGGQGRFRCQMNAKPQACDCGWSVNTKIVNGQIASEHEYPSMVALHDTTKNFNSFCGGAIVSHRYIVTAAHCTRTQPVASNIWAIVGYHDLTTRSKYSMTYGIQQIIEHSGYTADPVTNDIALLLTTANIEWSRGVGPICLPSTTSNFAYSDVDVIGWGTTSFSGSPSDKLRKVQLMVMENSACQQSYQGITTINAGQLCTYDYTGNSRDSCQFDSGGPVIMRKARQFLVGVISFGKTCGEGGYATGVNTRITYHVDWIRQNTGYTTCPMSM